MLNRKGREGYIANFFVRLSNNNNNKKCVKSVFWLFRENKKIRGETTSPYKFINENHTYITCLFKKKGKRKGKEITRPILSTRFVENRGNRSRLVGERMENKHNHRCRWFVERKRRREKEREREKAKNRDRSIEVCGRGEIDGEASRSCEAGRVIFQARSKLSTPQKKARWRRRISRDSNPSFPSPSKLERKMLEHEFEA